MSTTAFMLPISFAQTRRLGLSPFPCPPCLLCVGGVGFRLLAHRAQLGRLGGSRSG